MSKLLRSVWARLPRRRRRFWRYVSPQRRGAGVMLLAVLVAMVYVYWYQTNDRRVRREAERYLRTLTGGRAKVREAHFSLFGGIRLENVRLDIPKTDAPEPFFLAEKVLMRHRPWDLLLAGGIKPTEIVCIEPVITLEYEAQSRSYTAQRFLAQALERKELAARKLPMKLPRIRVRGGRLVVVDVEGHVRRRAGEVPLEVSMVPRGRDNYVITFEETSPVGHGRIKGQIVVDLTTGKIASVSGVLPLEKLDKTLPRRYRLWRQRYQLQGEVKFSRSAETSTDAKLLEVTLVDVSMRLPEAEGGLQLTGVHGELVFDPNGVTLRGIAGRIPQAGEAQFKMSGRYDGYEPTAPYEVDMVVEDLTVPFGGGTTGGLAAALENLRQTYHPEGSMNVSVKMWRDADGEFSYAGHAEPKGMSLLLKHFPYRIGGITGRIAFRPGLIELEDLKARRGEANFRITGTVRHASGRRLYDVTVKVDDTPFDEELRQAIPVNFLRVWKALAPIGSAGATVRVHRGAEDEHRQVDVRLEMKGNASIEYRGFPYRVERLVGDVYISGGSVRIDSVRGSRGAARCTIDGTIGGLGSGAAQVKLRIVGRDLPLDEILADAAGKQGRAALAALRPNGSAKQFTADVWKGPSQPLDYRVTAELKDVTFNLKAFPYEISQTAGMVTILPRRVVLEALRGVHGRGQITATGQVHLGEELGLDLHVEATGVTLDEEFYQALPPRFKSIYEQLTPSGLADMSLSLQRNLADSPAEDYRLVLRPRGMAITYRDFPYPLRGITGRIVATPGQVLLEDLACEAGQMRGTLRGSFLTTDEADRAELTISATDIPIDAELLGAFPAELAPLARRFEPSGACDIDLDKLRVLRYKTAPAGEADSTTQPHRPTSWDVAGSAQVRNATINLGFGKKVLTGRIAGKVKRNEEGLALEADISLDKVVMGDHRVTDLQGKLVKGAASSMIKLEDLVARSHGGWLAGLAQVELTQPLRYGISLSVERMRLEELFYPEGRGSETAKRKVTGQLDGRIELTETAGRIESRQASGVLRISGAELYKLPVLLDLLTVVFLSLPHDAAFTEGEFIYYLRGETLVFTEIYLRGRQISLVGSGSMNMKTKELKMTFLAGPPGALPRISGLADELLTGIIREIAEIRVTGTLKNPKTRTVPFRGLEKVLNELLRPGREKK